MKLHRTGVRSALATLSWLACPSLRNDHILLGAVQAKSVTNPTIYPDRVGTGTANTWSDDRRGAGIGCLALATAVMRVLPLPATTTCNHYLEGGNLAVAVGRAMRVACAGTDSSPRAQTAARGHRQQPAGTDSSPRAWEGRDRHRRPDSRYRYNIVTMVRKPATSSPRTSQGC